MLAIQGLTVFAPGQNYGMADIRNVDGNMDKKL
jgi:hypothetical protein